MSLVRGLRGIGKRKRLKDDLKEVGVLPTITTGYSRAKNKSSLRNSDRRRKLFFSFCQNWRKHGNRWSNKTRPHRLTNGQTYRTKLSQEFEEEKTFTNFSVKVQEVEKLKTTSSPYRFVKPIASIQKPTEEIYSSAWLNFERNMGIGGFYSKDQQQRIFCSSNRVSKLKDSDYSPQLWNIAEDYSLSVVIILCFTNLWSTRDQNVTFDFHQTWWKPPLDKLH